MYAKCGHCNNSGTKLQEIAPSGAKFKKFAVCCSSCSAVLGVLDYFETSALLQAQDKKIQQLTNEVSELSHLVRQMAQALRR